MSDLAERLKAVVDDPTDWEEPAPRPIEPGDMLLNDVAIFLGTFVAYPSAHARIAHTLWVVHSHLMGACESTPRIAFLSPEPASGKTRALEVTELLVPGAVEAVNVSPAYLFRKVGDASGPPTILFDEIDTVFGPKAKEHEDVRALLNAGHRRGAVAGRCIVRGKTVETVEFPAFCAVALAGLGDLPDTLMSRCVVVRMRRRAPNERVTPFRRRLEIKPGHALRDRLATWAASVSVKVRDAWPEMPPGIEDRDADVWEVLLAVADAAGGDWPKQARKAAVSLVSESRESTPSLGIRLLADIFVVFSDRDAMSTDDILSGLRGIDEAPWNELVGGRPLNARGLARRLGTYDVKSKQIREGSMSRKGYSRESLWDAWNRYLPLSPQKSETSETNETSGETPSNGAGIRVSDSLDPNETFTPTNETSETQKPYNGADVSFVSDVSDFWRDGKEDMKTDIEPVEPLAATGKGGYNDVF